MIYLSAITVIIFAVVCFKFDTHIDNLYKSRDALWREFNNEVQARKRQNAVLRGRIHGLREKLKEKNVKNSIP